MRKITLPFRMQTIIAGLILSWLVEFTPVFTEHYEQWNRFIYAIVALFLTLKIESSINRKKFRSGLIKFIKDLKTIRIKFKEKNYEIKPEVIQDVMKSTVSKMAGVLEQTENLAKEFRKGLYEERGNLHCGTCNTKHLTEVDSKCKICKIPSNFWKGVQD